ncbi:14268_t:CDS:1 [Cetraspora pellucida]|uniref:14268_t:CDS:1 n=1 Tax=Cetraspora pellucida TaxID=1433469 RepID=A0A9N9BDM4_9GLOM|nr:14268_t:CDS:1 [Cetraspora pellucida]
MCVSPLDNPLNMAINLLYIELLKEILENIIDSHHLFSCILVNRIWCRTGVPILWRSPNPSEKSLLPLVTSYLRCLPEEQIKCLKDENIPLPNEKTPIFDYPFFLKTLDLKLINDMSKIWINNSGNKNHIDFLKEIFVAYFLEQAEKISFIHLNESARTLAINQNAPNLKRFRKLHISSWKDETSFMEKITDHLQLISAECVNCKTKSLALASLIQKQKYLQHLKLLYTSNDDYCSIIFKSLPSQSNSLKKLELHRVNLNTIDSWESCYNLKALEIRNCMGTRDFSSNPWKPIFPNLQNLIIINYDHNRQFFVPFIVKIIEAAAKNLLHFKCSMLGDMSEIITSIALNCPNIHHLDLQSSSSSQIILILNSCHKLKTLKVYSNDINEFAFTEMIKHIKSLKKFLVIGSRDHQSLYC